MDAPHLTVPEPEAGGARHQQVRRVQSRPAHPGLPRVDAVAERLSLRNPLHGVPPVEVEQLDRLATERAGPVAARRRRTGSDAVVAELGPEPEQARCPQLDLHRMVSSATGSAAATTSRWSPSGSPLSQACSDPERGGPVPPGSTTFEAGTAEPCGGMLRQHGHLVGHVHRAVAQRRPERRHRRRELGAVQRAEVGAPVSDRGQAVVGEVEQDTDAGRPEQDVRLGSAVRARRGSVIALPW